MITLTSNINLFVYIAIVLTITASLMIYNTFFKKDKVIEGMATASGVSYEALQNLASMYKDGKLKVSELEVTGNAQVNGVIKGYELHCTRNGTWFGYAGKNLIKGDIDTEVKFKKKVTCDNELQITNGGGAWGTHFNYQNTGKTYIRGTFINLDKDNNKNGDIRVNGKLSVGETIKFRDKILLDTANPQGHGNVMKLVCLDHSSNNLLIGPQNGGKGYHIALDGGNNYYFNAQGRRYGSNRDDQIWG